MTGPEDYARIETYECQDKNATMQYCPSRANRTCPLTNLMNE